MLFDTWYDIWRLGVVGTAAYAGLVILLRTTGKRTLSKMNAFDLVVTVAFGSTFASAILSSEVSLSEALAAFALLCGLQCAVTYLSVRSERFQRLIKAELTLLFLPRRLHRRGVAKRTRDAGGDPPRCAVPASHYRRTSTRWSSKPTDRSV